MGRPIIQSVGSFCSLQFGAALATDDRTGEIYYSGSYTLGMWGYEMKHDYINFFYVLNTWQNHMAPNICTHQPYFFQLLGRAEVCKFLVPMALPSKT